MNHPSAQIPQVGLTAEPTAPASAAAATVGQLKRRRFIELSPWAGVALLAACSKAPEPAPAAPVAAPPAPAAPPPAATDAMPSSAASSPVSGQSPAAKPGDPMDMGHAKGEQIVGAAPMLSEQDPQAMALGYVSVATRTDTTRFKTYSAGSQCSNCALYQGKAGEANGLCPLFAGRQVAAAGWCSSWVKKG